MTNKTQPTAHAEITAPISADLRRIDDAGAQPVALIDQKTQRELMRKAGIRIEHSTLFEDDLPARELKAVQAEQHHLDLYTQLVAQRAALQAAPPAPAAVAVPEGWRELLEFWIAPQLERARKEAFERGDGPSANAFLDAHDKARAALAAAPAQAVPGGMWTIWESLPGYLIDHCEGDIISEEGLQRALEAMLKNPQYSMPPAAAAKTPKATGTAHLPYFSYDEDAGVQFWATQERAIKECQDAIDAYREDVEDGWPEDVESVRWGVVLGRAVKTDERPDQSCDYALTPYAAPAQEHATQLAGQAVAYLDLGAGGYLDIGTDLSEEQLSKLPKGRHMLVIGGTYGVDGYAAAPAQAQEDALDAAELEEVQRAISDFEDCGETHVGYDLLLRAANLGYLDCTRFATTDDGQAKLDAARAAQGGA